MVSLFPCCIFFYPLKKKGSVSVCVHFVFPPTTDGIEGLFSREFGVRYSDIDHLVVSIYTPYCIT